MKKLYEKNELTFAIAWIVIYCVLQSLANPLNQGIGIVHSAINTLGTFANDASLTTKMHLLHLGILIVVAVGYTLFLTRILPKEQ